MSGCARTVEWNHHQVHCERSQEWQPKGRPIEVDVHDFPDPDIPKAVPRGVYDERHNEGWVTVGCSHDMPSFAVESIRRWWREMGHPLYPEARSEERRVGKGCRCRGA